MTTLNDKNYLMWSYRNYELDLVRALRPHAFFIRFMHFFTTEKIINV